MDKFATFMVGGEELKAKPLTIQRLAKIWPCVERMSSGGSMVDTAPLMACIVAVATETDEDRIDNVPVEDMGRALGRKILVTEISINRDGFTQLMEISGMGPKKGNEPAVMQNLSTEIGTQSPLN